MKLVIGDKALSSWSLRPWLLMKHFGVPFQEVRIRLDQPGTRDEILRYSSAARVPVLLTEGLAIWDSLAIMEYLNERFPEKRMYPADPQRRAIARSLTAEMHSGFSALREQLPFQAKMKIPGHDLESARADIERVQEIWRDALAQSGGPFLMGDFSIVDAMYAPVVCRFDTYAVPLDEVLSAYAARILNHQALREWYDGARAEP